jgi:DNA invertase Pin-like site-specific DNA recombinase
MAHTNSMVPAGGGGELVRRAAQYVRMSTEHQQYSTSNQAEKIQEYASHRNLDIVRTYADEGKSGLRIDGRAGLQQLLHDVESRRADFSVILVYDVSRWGRFQDADESAYYEYVCRRAGIQVAYCAEQFENDGSPVSTIVNSVKRAMAGEYSRELSAKVFAGQCRLVEMGFRQGGQAGFGLRRVLLDQTGAVKAELGRGEHKSLQTDRVILQLGPQEELNIVQQIYRWFTNDGLNEWAIAMRLNDMSISSDLGRAWTRASVHGVLTNEKYVGCNVYNRRSFKLKKLRVTNTPDMWIRKDDAFDAVVPQALFYTAQGIIRARSRRFSDVELVEQLRTLFNHRGYLSGLVIDEAEGMASSSVYGQRFGSLMRAYQMVGFTPARDLRYIETNRHLRRLHPKIVAEVETQIEHLGGRLYRRNDTDLLDVNHKFSVSLVLSRYQMLDSGCRRWKVRLEASLAPDITLVIRLSSNNEDLLDYYLLPSLCFEQSKLSLTERNPIELESFRFDTLDYLYGMAEHVRLRKAA